MLKFLMCDKYNEFFLDWFLISEVEGHGDGFPDNKVLYSGAVGVLIRKRICE